MIDVFANGMIEKSFRLCRLSLNSIRRLKGSHTETRCSKKTGRSKGILASQFIDLPRIQRIE